MSKSRLIRRTCLHGEIAGKSTVLLEFETNLKYVPGDHVGVFAKNRPELVDKIIKRLKGAENPDEPVELQILKETQTSNGNTTLFSIFSTLIIFLNFFRCDQNVETARTPLILLHSRPPLVFLGHNDSSDSKFAESFRDNSNGRSRTKETQHSRNCNVNEKTNVIFFKEVVSGFFSLRRLEVLEISEPFGGFGGISFGFSKCSTSCGTIERPTTEVLFHFVESVGASWTSAFDCCYSRLQNARCKNSIKKFEKSKIDIFPLN